jgi:hypothetical protein
MELLMSRKPELERERFTAWISRYALTDGIFERYVEKMGNGIVWVVGDEDDRASWTYGSFSVEGRDWHRTRAGAIERAKKMQAAKLKSIDRQRQRIAALKFE